MTKMQNSCNRNNISSTRTNCIARSFPDYCSVAFHSSLTIENSDKLEQIQKTCLKVILGEMYVGYFEALEMCGLKLLSDRRKYCRIDFARNCLKHPKNSMLFPLKQHNEDIQHDIRNREYLKYNLQVKTVT